MSNILGQMSIFFIISFIIVLCGCKQKSMIERPQNDENDPRFFWSVDWHPSEDIFVVGGMQDTLRVFSSIDFRLLKNYPYKGTITKVNWHPTDDKLAITVQDGKSHSTILNFKTDQSTKLDSISHEGARAVGWNFSGDMLAVGDYEGNITIFDDDGVFIRKIHTQQKSIIGLDWHPHENLIAAIGEKITLYDYTLDSLKHIEDRSKEVLMLCVAWNPNGKFFVTGDYGDFEYDYPPLLQYWTYDGQRIKSIVESEAEYRNLKWASNGELLVTASEKVRLWNQRGDVIAHEGTQNLLWGIDWNEDNTKIVATDEDGKIIIWDSGLNTLTELKY